MEQRDNEIKWSTPRSIRSDVEWRDGNSEIGVYTEWMVWSSEVVEYNLLCWWSRLEYSTVESGQSGETERSVTVE